MATNWPPLSVEVLRRSPSAVCETSLDRVRTDIEALLDRFKRASMHVELQTEEGQGSSILSQRRIRRRRNECVPRRSRMSILGPGAGDRASISSLEGGHLVRTCGLSDRTPGVETAAGRLLERVGNISFQPDTFVFSPRLGSGNGG